VGVAAVYHNPFDTGDTTHFKVTAVADPDAAAAEFFIKREDTVRVYLTPRFWITRGSFDVELPYFIFSLPMMAPWANLLFDDHSLFLNGGTTPQPAIGLIGSSERWTHLVGFVHAHVDGAAPLDEFGFLDSYGTGRAIPILVGVIVRNGVNFYVWKVAADPTFDSNDSPLFKSATFFPPV
jgi:hypothetical protein